MKKLLFSIAIAASVLAAGCNSFSNRGDIDMPYIEAANNMAFSVEGVTLTDSSTVLDAVVYQVPGALIRFNSGSSIIADGKEYMIVSADSIVLDENFAMPDSGALHLSMRFPAIPASVKSIDFTENVADGWQLWGIQLDPNYEFKSEIPADLSILDADASLSEESSIVADTTIVNIHLLNYRPSMGSKLSYYVSTLTGQYGDLPKLDIDKEGNAVFKKQLVGPEQLVLTGIGDVKLQGSVLMAPGETIDMVCDCRASGSINMYARSRFKKEYDIDFAGSDGRLDKINRATYDTADYGLKLYTGKFGNYKMSGDEYVDYVIKEYKTNLDSINAADVAPAVKEYSTLSLQANTLQAIAMAKTIQNNNYIIEHQLWGVPVPADSVKVEVSPERAREIAALIDINNLKLLAVYGTTRPPFLANVDVWNRADVDASLFNALADYKKAYETATSGKLDSEATARLKASAYPVFADVAEARQKEIEALLHSKAAEMIEPTPDVADDKVFEEIIKPYKGKVVVVDLWNTWCGPCRAAIASNEPLKSSELSSDDIVWVYIADESSPINAYLNMIPDIKGHHFRVNEDQIRKIREHFNVDGIPYYILVDREGNAAGRPDLRDHSLYISTILDMLK